MPQPTTVTLVDPDELQWFNLFNKFNRIKQMRTIEIDDDVYDYLKSKVTDFNEEPSDTLRRVLLGTTLEETPAKPHEFSEALVRIHSRFPTSATGRFLWILTEAHHQKPSEFHKILEIRGPKRCYFSKSAAEIENSGVSTQPKKIPDTDYWAMTNSSARRKTKMIQSALSVMGFSTAAIEDAARSVRRRP